MPHWLPAAMALALAGSPAVWITGVGLPDDQPGCNNQRLAEALERLRPELAFRLGTAPPGSEELQLTLAVTPKTGTLILGREGGTFPAVRTLSEIGSCELLLQTAAQVAERALDEFHPALGATQLEAAPAVVRSLRLAGEAAAGLGQGPAGTSPVVSLGIDARRGELGLALLVDLALPQNGSLLLDGQPVGQLSAFAVTASLAAGLSPRLGPGRLIGEGLLGAALTSVSLSRSELFQQQDGLSVAPFVGLRAGYALELPEASFVGLRAEERLALARSTFEVQQRVSVGSSGEVAGLVTRAFAFQGVIFVGRRFY